MPFNNQSMTKPISQPVSHFKQLWPTLDTDTAKYSRTSAAVYHAKPLEAQVSLLVTGDPETEALPYMATRPHMPLTCRTHHGHASMTTILYVWGVCVNWQTTGAPPTSSALGWLPSATLAMPMKISFFAGLLSCMNWFFRSGTGVGILVVECNQLRSTKLYGEYARGCL